MVVDLDKSKLDVFINKLVDYSNSDKVDNQYKNVLQRNNLINYLNNMYQSQPTILLVGEAPGYKGCRLTGIPFTSEYIISTHKELKVFTGCYVDGKQSEKTATIVWDILFEKEKDGKLILLPLLWNIFPFHPINNGCQMMNRKPTKEERELGFSILNELLELFPSIDKIYAVGKSAESMLVKSKNVKYAGTLRHPSHGGKKEFIEGIKKNLFINLIGL